MSNSDSFENHQNKIEKIAHTTKLRLVWMGIIIITIVFILILKVGHGVWPGWLILQRARIIGMMLLALFILICTAPFIIEYNRDPRPLSGPGKSPYDSWDL